MNLFRSFLRPSNRVSCRLAALAAVLACAGGCFHTHTAPPPANAVPATKPDQELAAETGTPVSSTPKGLMHDGAERKIQERLRAKELLTKEQITGVIDPATRDALRAFQKSEGLPTTGLPSYETVEHLDLKLDTIYRSRENAADRAATRTASPP